MNNSELVQQVVFALQELQVREVIVCAGARNIPIVEFLEKHKLFTINSFFEERSAAFYALGRVKITGRPVAVVTTSGTAAVETFPAVVEAYYQGLPLIIITADRPKSYRGSGAPQAIEQKDVFQSYCPGAVDWDRTEKLFAIQFNPNRPFHFNLCFEEPLLDQPQGPFQKKFQILNQAQEFPEHNGVSNIINPLVLISELKTEDRAVVVDFLKRSKLYFVAESLSGIKNHTALKNQELQHIFYSLSNSENIELCRNNFDSIIRIGGVPTLRLWRDLEYDLNQLPVFNFSQRDFSGLSRTSMTYAISVLQGIKIKGTTKTHLEVLNQKLFEIKAKLSGKNKGSEQNFFRNLSLAVGADPLYLGNSLPIREWDEHSLFDQRKQQVYGNRGANGIDGQVSSYLGWAKDFKRSWCVIGDLTALYDLAALTMMTAPKNTQKIIVVVNNSGGQIFSRLFKNSKYLNSHKLGFKNWAQMFKWGYKEVKTVEGLKKIPKNKNIIIEIKINNKNSEKFSEQLRQHVLKLVQSGKQ